MKNDKTVDVLNKLLEINNDRVEGYETAMKETDEADLKTLFAQLARTSSKFVTELTDEIRSMNGEPVEGTMISGKFFRAWMDVKAALTGRDRKAILSSCEFGEDKAVDTYEKVLRDDSQNLSTVQQDMVMAQHAIIKADHDKVRYLRDSFSRKSDDKDQRARASM
jgi:uncharacterized protein (TIGR02284 family)